jgi:UDPglucose 6-dehydrogenase
MQIAVVGTGYVGLVTGVCLADVGHAVTCVDLDKAKVEKLKAGVPPIFEPGIEGLLKRNLEQGRVKFTTDLAEAMKGAACIFIAVGTPQGEDGSADLGAVLKVAKDVGRLATSDVVVIVKSTVPVGTCDAVEKTIAQELKARGSALRARVASNPEFLKEGMAIEDFMKPDRVVVGVTDPADEPLFRELYKPFIIDDPGKLMIMERRSSEMTKYGANAMLATRISFMNELARLAEAVGANIDDVRRGIGADPRIGKKFLYAGPGYGGSCFPKDVAALRKTGETKGVELKVLNAVMEANEAQKVWAAAKVKQHFKDVRGKRLAVWGLAFKPGTDDVRESPAITIIEELVKHGATVVGHDPQAIGTFKVEVGELAGLTYSATAFDALKDADGVVLVTEWSEYKRPDWTKVKGLMRGHAAFDLRNQWSGEELRRLGFHYDCVGRPRA